MCKRGSEPSPVLRAPATVELPPGSRLSVIRPPSRQGEHEGVAFTHHCIWHPIPGSWFITAPLHWILTDIPWAGIVIVIDSYR